MGRLPICLVPSDMGSESGEFALLRASADATMRIAQYGNASSADVNEIELGWHPYPVRCVGVESSTGRTGMAEFPVLS